jgi:hypothetical protein
MEYTKFPVQSARKNPELNPKVSVIDALLPYKDDSTLFISFTDINKIGINPKYSYDTPIGIYAYPLKWAYNKIVDKTIPFAMNRPLIHLLKITANPREILSNRTYSSSKFRTDRKKLEKIFNFAREMDDSELNSDVSTKTISWEDFIEKTYKEYNPKRIIDKFWSLSRAVSKALSKAGSSDSAKSLVWNTVFRKVGYTVAIDYGTGYIHPNEPVQAVFFIKSSFKQLEVFDNKRYEIPVEFIGERGKYPASIKFDNRVDIEIIKNILKLNPEIKKSAFKASSLVANIDTQTRITRGYIYGGQLNSTVLGIKLTLEDENRINKLLIVGTKEQKVVLTDCIIYSGTYQNVEFKNCTILGGNFQVDQIPGVPKLFTGIPCTFTNTKWNLGSYDIGFFNSPKDTIVNLLEIDLATSSPDKALKLLKKYKYIYEIKSDFERIKEKLGATKMTTLF